MDTENDMQGEVLTFLANISDYGDHDRIPLSKPVQRIDTHSASVFLIGDRALKIKRAVHFPFLDYSTLSKRKDACRAELSVNTPYAPDIYRGVVPITRETDGRLAIAGAGTAVEWAIDMKQFDEERTLDKVIDHIDGQLAEALGKSIAKAHTHAPVVEAVPWIKALAKYLDQNQATFRNRPDLFDPDEVDKLDARSREHYARIQPLLMNWGRESRIIRGHGDLHLGNIALIDNQPVLFDAIEFDPLVATGDVLYDLAFLLMDLCERGRAEIANLVLNRYLIEANCIGDLDALAALPLFLSLRAAIRAMVTVARSERANLSKRRGIEQSARRYFAFAQNAVSPPTARLIAIGGLSGTGKTRLAKALAPFVQPIPGAVVVRSDVERKILFGVPETERLPSEAYTAASSVRVYKVVCEKARRVLVAGHSVIADAVFSEAGERHDIAAAAATVPKTKLHTLFLMTDLQTRLARVGSRVGDASDADETVVQVQEHLASVPAGWTSIDASSTAKETLKRALTAIETDNRGG